MNKIILFTLCTLLFALCAYPQDSHRKKVMQGLLMGELSAPSGQLLFRLADSTYLKTNDGKILTVDNPLISYLENDNEKNNYALLVDDRYWAKPKFLRIDKQRN